MKVEHITRRFVRQFWGGTESSVLGMAQGLTALGHSTEILTSMALDKTPMEEIDGITVRRFSYFYPYLGLTAGQQLQMDFRAGNLFSFSLLYYLMASEPADIYHLHTGKRLGGIVRTAARRHCRPYVVSLHGGVVDVPKDERERWTAPARESLEWGRVLGAATGARRVLHDASAILCVNREEQRILSEQMPGKRIVWTPNTVNVQRFKNGNGPRFRIKHGLPASARIVLNVARVDEQKNQLDTVEIFDRTAAQVPDLWLLLAGASTNVEYAERLSERIAASPNAARVRCLGNIESSSQDMADLYRAADLFLLSSVHEPFGIVLLEAWAAGTPIVASRVGGIPSFVQTGANGLLYESGDVAEASRLVVRLMREPGEAALLRDAAAKSVLQFDSERAIVDLISLYEEVRIERPVRA